jgi:alkylation response protein AidB-like acyl-CoA dehydrogenase
MNEEILSKVRLLADEIFRPMAEVTDQGQTSGQLATNIRLLQEAGYFGLGIGAEYGGMAADEATRQEYVELMASACGVTAFTQQQLQSGGGFLTGSENAALKQSLLPKMASGEILCGICFAHLRRPGPPVVTAQAVPGGYLINGTAPWLSGWTFMDSFVLGVHLPESDRHLYLYVEADRSNTAISTSPAASLVCMNASDTVAVTFNNLFVSEYHELYNRPAADMSRADYCGITGHVYQPLGCARGSIHYMRALAERRSRPDLLTVAEQFEREVNQCRHEAREWNGSCADLPDYKDHALHARTSTILLAVRAAHATIAATGGSAHYMDQPPQRLMREAIFYTTAAQTRDIQAGTLDLLVSPDCWKEA